MNDFKVQPHMIEGHVRTEMEPTQHTYTPFCSAFEQMDNKSNIFQFKGGSIATALFSAAPLEQILKAFVSDLGDNHVAPMTTTSHKVKATQMHR